MPLIHRMAVTGLQVDLSHFAALDIQLTRDMDQITEDVHDLTGHYINIDSGDQVADLLFKQLKLSQARVKFTQSGERESVEDEVLTAIQHDHPCIPKILEYKEFSKLRGTYVQPMPKLAQRTAFGKWRMYPKFNTTRVPSGRLSCKEPNLLAMPTRTERGREIRKGFIADPGWVYASCDLSQIEVRIAAHCSGDTNLMNVYLKEQDIYSDFATAAFKLKDERYKAETGEWKYPTVNKDNHRRPAKTCVLASIYDTSPSGLLEQMPIVCGNCNWISLSTTDSKYTPHLCGKFTSLWTEQKCESLLSSFYSRYPGIMADRKKNHRLAMRYGYIWDMWGRILHVQAVRSVHPWVVSAALREVGNLPYQGGAQGVMKLSMAGVHEDLLKGRMYSVVHPLLQVHDELVFECREDVAEDVIELTKYHFANCVRLRVDIKGEGTTAATWGGLK